MIIGFTGTRKGMQEYQLKAFQIAVQAFDTPDLIITQFHHGDCVGGDEQAHDFMSMVRKVETHVHPPLNPKFRAWCKGDVMYPEGGYHTRNRAIVHASTVMFGCPETETLQLRSGTWQTIQYARRMNKPLWIIYPDGTFNRERLALPSDKAR